MQGEIDIEFTSSNCLHSSIQETPKKHPTNPVEGPLGYFLERFILELLALGARMMMILVFSNLSKKVCTACPEK
jgi:hypothetical protein